MTQLYFVTPLVFVLFAVYSEANIKDDDDYVYRRLCIGLGYEEMDAVNFIKQLEKIRGKLNLLDVNVDVLKNVFDKIMDQVRMSVSKPHQRMAEHEFRSTKVTDGKQLKYCIGYYGEVPIPRILYEKLQEYVNKKPANSFLYTGPEPKFTVKIPSETPEEEYTIQLLKNDLAKRRLANEHWVEIANGVHKTELDEPPPDHLKNRLLYLLRLKEKMKNW